MFVSREGRGPLFAGGLAAILASTCCLGPLLLVTLGFSGAWIGNLTALEPYQPVFAGVALAVIGYGAYLVYWKPQATCVDGSYCARPSSSRLAKTGLWTAGTLVIAAVAFPHVIRVFAF